tara:strand:+ start:12250 stop:13515 length:1266 start_codon:yes stop_codon:yes gene_type:complete
MNKIERLKKFGLLLIGMLTFQLALSQGNYFPGYVIKKSTDTLYGYIDYRNWDQNPDKINFKTNTESNPISFNPIDIIEFKVDGELYVSGIIKTEVSPTQTNRLNYNPRMNTKVDTTFLQTLFRGEKSLYYYKKYDGGRNFYIKENSGFKLLTYKRYLKQQDGKDVVTENRNYLGQLSLYLNDCETINSKLENTSYKQKSLIKLFEYYYECSQSDVSFQKELEKIHVETGILAGASLTSLKFSDALPYLVEADYNESINFSAGIFFDFILPRNQGRWSINNEVLYTTYEVNGSYEEYQNENFYSLTTTEFEYTYLKINNLVRFKNPIGHLSLFFNGGISNGFVINEKNYKKEVSVFYPEERVVEELALNDTRKHELGFLIGTGLKYNRYSLEVRYEKANGMSDYATLSSSTDRLYVLLGFRF